MHAAARRRSFDADHLDVAARRLACRWMSSRRAWVAGVAVIAVATFGGSVAALHLAWLDLGAYLSAALLSLVFLGGCLALGYLGDPLELRRRAVRVDAKAPPKRRSALQTVRPVARFDAPLGPQIPRH